MLITVEADSWPARRQSLAKFAASPRTARQSSYLVSTQESSRSLQNTGALSRSSEYVG